MPTPEVMVDTPTPLLLCKNVEVRRGISSVIHGADLEVKEGEIVALMGPNGCGKSTLLETAAGMHMMRSGSTSHRDDDDNLKVVRNHNGHRGIALPFGLTLQKDSTSGDELVGERIQLAIDMAGGRNSDADIMKNEARKWGLSHRLNDRVAWLSGGMARRVSVLCGLIPAIISKSPRLIILDEPASGLDEIGRDLLRSELESMAKSGNGILLATHDKSVSSVATRIVTWEDEQIITDSVIDDEPRELANSRLDGRHKSFRAWANILDYRTWGSIANNGVAGLLAILLMIALSVDDLASESAVVWMMTLISIPALVAGLIPPSTLRHLDENACGKWWDAQSAGILPIHPPQALPLVGAALTAISLIVLPHPNWNSSVDGAIDLCIIALGGILTWVVSIIQVAQWRLVSSLERSNALLFSLFLPFLAYPFLLWSSGTSIMLDSDLQLFERFSNLLTGFIIFIVLFSGLRLLKPQ